MSAERYYEEITDVLGKIPRPKQERIQQAAEAMATAIAAGKALLSVRQRAFGNSRCSIFFLATAASWVSFRSTIRG